MADNPEPQVFRCRAPGFESGRRIVRLARTDRMYAQFQVLKSGGESALHSHTHLDGFWMVLKGKARFYGEGDRVVAEIGPMEGVLIPRGFRYWFESAGDEVLELLQVESADVSMGGENDKFSDITHHTSERRLATRVEPDR
jgi:mannose-6-phosphate isomerase-like protein (cupin superfamily)